MKRTIILTLFSTLIFNTINASVLKRSPSQNKLQQTQNSPSAEHILSAIKNGDIVAEPNPDWTIKLFNRYVKDYNAKVVDDPQCKLKELNDFRAIKTYIAELNAGEHITKSKDFCYKTSSKSTANRKKSGGITNKWFRKKS